MPKPTTLSDTARAILTAAAARGDRIALPPDLPAAAKRAVVQSLLKAGLLEEIAADDDQPAWRTGEDGTRYVLRITDAGLGAIGAEPEPEDEPEDDRPRHETPSLMSAAMLETGSPLLGSRLRAWVNR